MMTRVALLLLLVTSACAKEELVFVRIQGQPGGALVYIDDRYIGRLEQLQARGIEMPEGEYRLTIQEVGYFPHDQLLLVNKSKVPRITVRLTPIPD
ncbi:MAG TPA: PEGA domain-containing protein [Polyangiaceae bacterium]|nr:PEGA domain-containing protein [Polyangiaceae bacterium]